MLKRLFLILVIVCAVLSSSITAYAETNEETYAQIDAYLQSEFGKTHIPGLAIMVVDKDSVLFSNTYGNCDSIDTSFVIGSMSKSFTAIAIMQLVEQDKVNLDDNISNYLPELDIGDSITVRQLLNQTSGLGTYQTRSNLKITNAYGTHRYANVNYNLLGEIIEAVSGISYEEYIEENIYRPIGMNNSYTSLEEGENNGLIAGYRNYFGFAVPQEVAFPSGEGWTSVSAGYLIASAFDMGKYLQMYMNDGDGIVSAASINTVFYDNVYDKSSDTYYGMGWFLNKNYSEPMLLHSGLVENYTSTMFILPESGIGVVMLLNMNDYFVASTLMNSIGESVILQLLGEEMIPLSATSYTFYHLLLNALYIAILLAAILPAVFIKRWRQKTKDKKISKILKFDSILHVVFPTLLLLLPTLISTPFFVIQGFVPDLFIVLLVSAAVSYVTGIIKAGLLWRKRTRG